jgi:hypothetical protein
MTPEENARLEAVERRLARLETLLAALAPQAGPVSAAPPPVVPHAGPVLTGSAPRQAPSASAPPPAATHWAPQSGQSVAGAPPPPRDIETTVGLTWLSRIAVLTIVLALAFFFKYAFENHWITEWGRVLLGVACGLGAAAAGERFWRGGQRTYAQSLTAAGIGFLYLSCWAAFALYHVVPQSAAFAAMVLVTAGAGALSLRYESQAVALLGLAGGFATPLLLSSATDAWFVFAYALVLDAGAALATRRRQWRWTEPIALIGTIALYVSQTPVPPGQRALYTVFALAWYGLFAASALPAVFAAAQILAGPVLVEIWNGSSGAMAAALPITAVGLWVADRRGWSAAAGASFAGFWLSFEVWTGYTRNSPPFFPAMTLVTAAFILFLVWPVWVADARKRALRIPDLIVLALNAAFYFGAGYVLLSRSYRAWEGLFAVATGAVYMSAARLLWRRDARGSMLAAAVAWVLLVVAAPIQFAGYRITIAWTAEAAAVTWIATRLRERRLVNAALAVFLLVFLRLAVLDSVMYPNPGAYGLLLNARFLTFAVAAVSLWAAAWWVAEGRRALVLYLGGHVVMLWGLFMEAVGWAARTSAPQNIQSVASTSISVIAAGYAVLLVAVGVARRSGVTRVAGIALIGMVILKLYLYDVWLLAQFYRMTAFAILGVLLLAMSYLYSRFRGTIGNWWRPNQ